MEIAFFPDRKTRIGVAKNTLTREDVADVEGQLRFVKATEIRENLELAEGMRNGIRALDGRIHAPRWYRNNLALNHHENDESALPPEKDPHMEAVPTVVNASPSGSSHGEREFGQATNVHGLSVTL